MTDFPWLQSENGRTFLAKRLETAVLAFFDEGLDEKIEEELAALLIPDSRDFRLCRTIWTLAEEMSVICMSAKFCAPVENRIWDRVNSVLIDRLPRLDALVFQGRTNSPKWNSDLLTAEIGVCLALALFLDGEEKLDRAKLECFVQEKCVRPIIEEWLDHGTRIHALDTMGHNWWSVIVGGAGIMAVCLGQQPLADRIASALKEWFHYGGNEFARKRRNFGEDGDFVESFHYAEYALYHPIGFSRLFPSFQIESDALNSRQIAGLAKWIKYSILPNVEGYPQQRFGDIQFYDEFRGLVLQTIAKLAKDDELEELAYRFCPEPEQPLEMLFWEEKTQASSSLCKDPTLSVYPNSGIAFVRNREMRLTTRAGEFWGHNHLDAGSFIFNQEGVTWIDDSGACEYGRKEYTEYYVSAAAHNVAYAPALATSSSKCAYEGLPHRANYLVHAEESQLKVLCADTGILSGSALARSHRWFFSLGDEGILVWDDLVAYQAQKFVFLLHTTCGIDGAPALSLRKDKECCPLHFYSNVETQFQQRPAAMGQISGRGEKPVQDLEGKVLTWETNAENRVKFGLAFGTRLRMVEWSRAEGGGVECTIPGARRKWVIWFNPLADGQVMHANALFKWRNFETDAYALVIQEEAGQRTRIHTIEGSFLRRGGHVLAGSLTKQPLLSADLLAASSSAND